MKYVYSVEMFGKWEEDSEYSWKVEIRIYYCEKLLSSFDLCDITGKRRNAKFLYSIPK